MNNTKYFLSLGIKRLIINSKREFSLRGTQFIPMPVLTSLTSLNTQGINCSGYFLLKKDIILPGSGNHLHFNHLHFRNRQALQSDLALDPHCLTPPPHRLTLAQAEDVALGPFPHIPAWSGECLLRPQGRVTNFLTTLSSLLMGILSPWLTSMDFISSGPVLTAEIWISGFIMGLDF